MSAKTKYEAAQKVEVSDQGSHSRLFILRDIVLALAYVWGRSSVG